MAKQRALIIGGSVGGLFAANLLRSVGWDAVVFERNSEELTGRGAGISTHPQLHDVMRRLGIPFDTGRVLFSIFALVGFGCAVAFLARLRGRVTTAVALPLVTIQSESAFTAAVVLM